MKAGGPLARCPGPCWDGRRWLVKVVALGAIQAAPVPADAMSVSLQMREREVKLWDTRRLSGATLTVALDTSPG